MEPKTRDPYSGTERAGKLDQNRNDALWADTARFSSSATSFSQATHMRCLRDNKRSMAVDR